MDGAEIIVLPVVRVERDHIADAGKMVSLPAIVTDINAFRARRGRALVERRASRSLLPELGEL